MSKRFAELEEQGKVRDEQLQKLEKSMANSIELMQSLVKKQDEQKQAMLKGFDEQKQELFKNQTGLINNNALLAQTTEKNTKKIITNLQEIEKKAIRIQQQPRLSYFVLNILDHCNLKCKGCDHFAAIAEERFVSLVSIQNDLKRMAFITNGAVTRIGIMGGEPLLHPDLIEILHTAREAFPKSLLQLVTNGILLLSQSNLFWNVCRENEIIIVVTKYPINLDHDRMMETAKANKVKFQFYGNSGIVTKTSYKMPMDVDGMQNAKLSFWNCYHVNTCPLVMEGKLYPCTIIPNSIHFNQKFDVHLDTEEGDYLDIYEAYKQLDLLSYLSTPKPFCRYCKTNERTYGHIWERSKQEISEWM